MLLSKVSLPCCLIPFFTVSVKYPRSRYKSVLWDICPVILQIH